MNDFFVCPCCFTVLYEDDIEADLDEGPFFDCGCDRPFVVSWWELRVYDPNLPLFPEIGGKYSVGPILLTAENLRKILTTTEDELIAMYKDIPRQQVLPFMMKEIA